jgi:hypothetical protein
MIRNAVLAVLAIATIAPLLGAQTPRPRKAPRPEARTFSFSYSGNRARIGVLVSTQANTDTDRLGAKLDGVTPGGPAEKAGLKTGDIITRFNGTSLAGVTSEDGDESGPGHKLIELVSDLDPGDTVRVEYRRGSDTKTARIVTDESSRSIWRGGEPAIAGDLFGETGPFASTARGFSVCFGDAWCDLDLVTLSPDLGEYFGTREGILVVKAPGDSALPLKGGDVILSIGGRKPTSPEHAMRILRSYDVGESVSIEIMRHERRQTLSWTVPQREGIWRQRGPRGQGEQSFWRVQPGVEAATERAAELEMEKAERGIRDLLRHRVDDLRLRVDDELRQQEIRALQESLWRASTSI